MKSIFLLFFTLLTFVSIAQQKTFKRFYNGGVSTTLNFYDTKQTLDGGYVSTGIHTTGGVNRPLIYKTDCNGHFVWSKYYGNTTGSNNIFMKVLPTNDSGFMMLNNTGSLFAMNIIVIKFDKQGNETWKKIINNNTANDIGQSIVSTPDKGYVIAGVTNSFGTDVGSFYDDIFIAKIDSVGNWKWGKSIGRAGAYNQATKVVVTKDGGLALTGRYIEQGAFFSFLLKTNDTGQVQFLKTWGDTLHSTYGLDLVEDDNGGIYICGTTTVAKTDYLSYSDHFLSKFNANGDTVWNKLYHGTSNDMFETPYSICFDKDKNIVLGIETNSYPSSAVVQNRQGYLLIDTNGSLIRAKTFNEGYSQYTRISPTMDKGFIVNGFGTINSSANSRGNIIKLDSNLNSGCIEFDVTALTLTKNPAFKFTTPSYTLASGGSIANYTITNNFVSSDTTVCEVIPSLNPVIVVADTCFGSNTMLTYTGANSAIFNSWHIVNSAGLDTSFNTTNVSFEFPSIGTYTVQLIVGDGCDTDSSSTTITIIPNPIIVFTSVPPSSITLGDTGIITINNTTGSIIWSNGSTLNSTNVFSTGTYSVSVTENGCTSTDSLLVIFRDSSVTSLTSPTLIKDTIILPNAFTPGNNLNSTFKPIVVGNGIDFIEMRLYNRYGNEVFVTTSISNGWDGSNKNQTCSLDVYYYLVRYRNKGVTKILKGNVTLLR